MTTWSVLVHPDAEQELAKVPAKEAVAIAHAIEKLEAIGPDLGYPHTSAVKHADNVRELRPRAGRSAWRVFYRRIGDALVIAAVGPEAEHNPRGFRAAVRRAMERLDDLEED